MTVTGIGAGSRVDMMEGGGAGRSRVEESGAQAGDTVSISEEAKALAEARARETATDAGAVPQAEDEEYPLEAYRMPDWFVDLFGGYTMVNTELGMSWEEARTGYDKLDPADQRRFDEYAEIVSTTYREELDKVGVLGDTGKYYHDFLNNYENQLTVREALYERLENNPRAMELMKYFGIEMG